VNRPLTIDLATGLAGPASVNGHPLTLPEGARMADFDSLGDARWVQLANLNTLGDARWVQLANLNALGDARWSLLGHTHTFASLTSKPTTIAGYGITDFNSLGDARWPQLTGSYANPSWIASLPFSKLTSTPTTIAGYGISDFNSLGDARWAIAAGTTAQFWRGDKSWQTLNTAVVPESGSLYFTNARAIAAPLTGYVAGAGTITSADSILVAIQKNAGNLAALVLPQSSLATASNWIRSYDASTGAFTKSQPTFTDLAAHPTTIGGYGITDFNSLGDARWQPLDSDLTSWALITRASGFDAFAATPTLANLKTLVTDETTVGWNLLTLANPGAITFLKLNADNSVSAESAGIHRTSLGATTVGGNLFTLANPGAITFLQINADNSVTAQSASSQRTAIGATTIGANIFTMANPSQITFPRYNADNTVTARTAAQLKTDLLLNVGVNVQAWDPDLDTWAGLTPSANAQSLVTAANYAAMKTLLGLTIGTDVQAFDADLNALAALSGTNTLYYRSAANTWSPVTIGGNLTFSTGTLDANAAPAETDPVFSALYVDAGDLATTDGSTLVTLPVGANHTFLMADNSQTAGLSWPNASNARSFLGLGSAATANTGTSGANLPFLNGINTWGATQTFTSPVLNGLPTGTGVASAGTASTLAARDASANITANNWLGGYATIATAAGTTTLTVASAYVQFFTGSSTQTVTLPVASTLTLGHQFVIVNNSTGNVTVNSSGGNAVVVLAGGTSVTLTCVLVSGTTAASWNASYGGMSVASGKKGTFSNSLTLAGTDGSTLNVGSGGTLGSNAFTSTPYAPLASPTFTGTVTIPTLSVTGNADFSANVVSHVAAAGTLNFQVSKTQNTNDTGVVTKYFGGAAGATVRGQYGFTHTGTGGDTLFTGETADGFAFRAEGDLILGGGGDKMGAKVDGSTTANDTRFLLWDVTAASFRRVTIGANDSGGTGFRVLRIPN
jgi:hypothetical protein